jgi:chromate transporter
VQLLAIGLAAVMGQWLHPSRGAAEGVTPDKTAPSARSQLGSARLATVCLTIFAIGLILSLATLALQPGGGNLYAYHYKAGALVFGGGHVVLPLLNDGVAATRLVSEAEFLAGYGMAQALPGPLFTLSAYLGTVAGITSPSFIGGLLALVALFAPGLLLIIGLLPYWDILQQKEAGRRALAGVNAAVVGLLVAAFIDPVWVEAIRAPSHFAIAGSALLLLYWSKVPTAVVVLLCAIAGYGLSLTGYTSSL